MEATKEIKSQNVSDLLESCLENVKEGFEATLTRTLKWGLHPTEKDAVSELARSELAFLMLINSLANLDAPMSVLLLKGVDRWSLFPRLTKYMSGKLDAEWDISREMLDRAAKFAIILERSGMFTVPQVLHRYLAELLLDEEGGSSASGGREDDFPTHDKVKWPRKNPRMNSPSSQEDNQSNTHQASGQVSQQVIRARLVARRRSHKVRQRQRAKEARTKTTSQKQQITTVPKSEESLSAGAGAIPKTETGKQDTSVLHSQNRLSTGAIPKINQQTTIVPKSEDRPSTGAIPKTKIGKQTTIVPKSEDRPSTGAIPKTKTSKITSTASQTLTPMITSTASQTLPPMMSQEAAQKQLWKAVDEDDSIGIEDAVGCGACMELRNEEGWTPLTLAAYLGKEVALRTLIILGANLERKSHYMQGERVPLHHSPLYHASAYGREKIVALLLAAGANVDSRSEIRSTPLIVASSNGHLNIVRHLVEAGADVNARNSKGDTPLSRATRSNHNSIINFLLSVGGQK